MAQGRPSRGESVTENIQDYVEETFQNATELPDQGAVRDHGGTDPGTSQGNFTPSGRDSSHGATPSVAPGTEAALEEHLAATENVRGAGQSSDASSGTADVQSAAVQREARNTMIDRTNDELGMGNIRR